ncbi:hypothetical protein PUNSTDRAFT_42543 [Punctularia strigosozonata HHB-11173 SS5]|uniref:uncharacterized protein n=1 Tax=Punctularia strigosozonata (strain HHB-11173) TaxID=741275 RepID=UPI0004417B83|nr:uncharacterized protein PUNSTDRAFT_42543 [Punctularia strigosozonata HHB-11173 SS5]EIN11208.1 hypothetical protein PUNSTDRAFT_42543 [Punctularia strigosozonata HHB-11173 SS5]
MAAALSAPEILLMVLEHLDFHPLPSITVANRMHGYTGWPVFDVGAVRAFSEVCRSWAALAQPLLFRHAVLRKRRHVLSSLAAIIHGSKTRGRLLRDAVYRITLSVGPDEEDAHAIQRRPSSSDGLFLGENLDQPPNTHDLVNLLRSCPDRGLQLLCVNSVRGKLNGRQPHSEEAHLDTLGLDERALRALKAPPSVTCLSVSTCSDKPDRTPWQLLSLLAPTIKILALTGTGHIPEYNGPALTQLRLNEFIWMKERAEGWSTIPYILSSSIGHLRSIEAEGTHIHPADVLQQHRMHLESVRITQMRSVSSPQQAWLSYPRLKELILDTSDYHAPRGEGQTLLASETMQHLAGRISDDLELWHAVMERLPNLRTVTVGWKDDVRGLEAECAAQSIEVRSGFSPRVSL